MNIVDLHCDTIYECWQNKDVRPLRDGDGHLNLEMMKEGGALLQCFAVFISMPTLKELGITPWEYFDSAQKHFHFEMDRNSDLILPATNYDEIMANKEAGKMSAMLTIEDGVCLEGKMENLYKAYDDGVRLITLMWNHENEIGSPNRKDADEHKKGLKPFGKDLVAEMNRLGVIVDVSHSSEGNFYDVAEISTKPFVASHSCARDLCDHQRNLDDKQLKVLGEKGGVCGINFYADFLNDDGSLLTFDRVLEHAKHIKDKAGIDAVAMGSDFDGIEDPGEIVNYAGFPKLVDYLQKEFTDDEIDKITHENALRVIKEVCK
ncbi:MAG: dipeptidase [Clostridia bacterium]|nr:dipeptidase [Clostridia bacterium]